MTGRSPVLICEKPGNGIPVNLHKKTREKDILLIDMEEVKKSQPTSFKTCSKCGFVWDERVSFLSDPQLCMVGYQVDFDELRAGLFLFNHSCGTTLSVCAGDFQDLYNGPIFVERLNGTEKCQGFCLHENELRPCPAQCECAYVLEVTQVVLKWPKTWMERGGPQGPEK